MGRVIQRTIVLRNPATHMAEAFEAGVEAPAWAEDLIDNEKVWTPLDEIDDPEDDEPEDDEPEDDEPEDDEPEDDEPEDDEPEDDEPEQPARKGAGSGVEAWREWAEAVNLGTPADADRKTIIAAADARQ